MKKLSLLLACIILLSSLTVGCNKSPARPDYTLTDVTVDPDSPIPIQRTGTLRSFYGLGFECTSQGSYFMANCGIYCWLLYVDHSSDEVIKLCGRPDCSHSDSDCNAWFRKGGDIRYCDGYLYVYGQKTLGGQDGIIRMNLDGTDQVKVFDFSEFRGKNKIGQFSFPELFQDIASLWGTKLDENGERIDICYYYRFDGSMDEPVLTTSIPYRSDGDVIIGLDYSTGENVYGIWEAGKGITKELFRDTERHNRGYIGKDAEYYIKDGVVYERTYPDDVNILFDTGLGDTKQSLFCYPDCMVVWEWPVKDVGVPSKLHFYDWRYNHLGSVTLDSEKITSDALPILGETADRIILHNREFPTCYIDKSEFGTGKIEIHEFKLPEDFYEPIPDHMDW